MGLLSAGALATGITTAAAGKGDWAAVGGAGIGGVAVGAIAMVLMLARRKSFELEDGDPILSLDKDTTTALLRSDSWVLMLDKGKNAAQPGYAVLGKNEPYGLTGVTDATKLSRKGTTTGVILEDTYPGEKITIRVGEKGGEGPTITLDGKEETAWIKAKKIVIRADPNDGGVAVQAPLVTFTGDVEIYGTLTADGDTELSKAIQAKP